MHKCYCFAVYLLQREENSKAGEEGHGEEAVSQHAGHTAEGDTRHTH